MVYDPDQVTDQLTAQRAPVVLLVVMGRSFLTTVT